MKNKGHSTGALKGRKIDGLILLGANPGKIQQRGQLLREPLGTILHRIPLSERIYDATVLRTGPYAPSLQMACALEGDDASVIRRLCEEHEMDLEEVNRALLRVLSEFEVERPPASR